jgi:ferritin-like protein
MGKLINQEKEALKQMATEGKDTKREEQKKKECFVLMPISDQDGENTEAHFMDVFNDIIEPACIMAGYEAIRADQVKKTNLIHLDILKKIIESPIAICDLSNRNPNVLFELGIRQSFDMPVVLIQERGTKKIFDISPLRIKEYSRDLKYHDVIKFQLELKDTIQATMDAKDETSNVNSIVKLMALNKPAKLPNLENEKENFMLEIIRSELGEIKNWMNIFTKNFAERGRSYKNYNQGETTSRIDRERILNFNKMTEGEKLDLMHQRMLQEALLDPKDNNGVSREQYFRMRNQELEAIENERIQEMMERAQQEEVSKSKVIAAQKGNVNIPKR